MPSPVVATQGHCGLQLVQRRRCVKLKDLSLDCGTDEMRHTGQGPMTSVPSAGVTRAQSHIQPFLHGF